MRTSLPEFGRRDEGISRRPALSFHDGLLVIERLRVPRPQWRGPRPYCVITRLSCVFAMGGRSAPAYVTGGQTAACFHIPPASWRLAQDARRAVPNKARDCALRNKTGAVGWTRTNLLLLFRQALRLLSYDGKSGAGYENQTRLASLEGWNTITMPTPRGAPTGT